MNEFHNYYNKRINTTTCLSDVAINRDCEIH